MKTKPTSPPAPEPKRILLVDDHPILLDGLAQWISRFPDLVVCGQAESAAQALVLVGTRKPDLVITDISLPGRNGIDLIKDLRVLQPNLPVLVLSTHDESLYAERALHAGARGYLMKHIGGERLREAIHEVLRGGIAVSPGLTTRLLEEFSGHRPRAGRIALANLTDREFEILQMIGEAKGTREIAGQLHLSPKTVGTHRMNLKRKLNLKTSAEMMRLAMQYTQKALEAPDKG